MASNGGAAIGASMPVPAFEAAIASVGNLPRDSEAFTGRTVEFAHLCAAISAASGRHDSPPPVYSLNGMPGIGKTALAVHAAHRVAEKFPDGVHFLDLHGHSATRKPVETAEALRSLLITFGVAADQVPPNLDDRESMWRRRMAGRRALLLADNAASEQQIRPLLPSSPGLVVLVTSRRQLANLHEAQSITLETMTPEHAAAMFLKLSGSGTDQSHLRKAETLVRLCGYLPLAVALTAGRMRSHPTWTIDHLARQLTETQPVVEGLYSGELSVEAAFDLSYRDLQPDQKQLFRRLTLHPGADIDVHAAAALDDAAVHVTQRRLESLFLNHLVDEPSAGRYRLHDLIREYAGTLLNRDPAEERENCAKRLLDHYQRGANAACHQVYGRQPAGRRPAQPMFRTSRDAEEWITTERANLDSCIDYSSTNGYDHTTTLAIAVHPFLVRQGQWDRAASMHRVALQNADRTGDIRGRAWTLLNIGSIDLLLGHHVRAAARLREASALLATLDEPLAQAFTEYEAARVRYRQRKFSESISGFERAHSLFTEQKHPLGQAHTLAELGHAYYRVEKYDWATTNLVKAHEIYVDLEHRAGQARTLTEMSKVQGRTGNYREAVDRIEPARKLYVEIGDTQGHAHTLSILGRVSYRTGNYAISLEAHAKAHGLYSSLGDRLNEAHTLNNEGRVYNALGDHGCAVQRHESALAIYTDLGDRLGEAHALTNIGRALLTAREPALAGGYFTRAHGLYVSLKSPNGQANALMGLGCVHLENGAPDLAFTNLTKAYDLFGDDRACRAEALYHLGTVLLAQTKEREGRQHLQQSLAVSREIGAALQEAHVLVALGADLIKQGRRAEATATLDEASGIFEQLGARKSDQFLSAQKKLRE